METRGAMASVGERDMASMGQGTMASMGPGKEGCGVREAEVGGIWCPWGRGRGAVESVR